MFTHCKKYQQNFCANVCLFVGVKGVRVVKGVKAICLVAINQFSNWIFHFSLFTFHSIEFFTLRSSLFT